jgi:hypothetical protein
MRLLRTDAFPEEWIRNKCNYEDLIGRLATAALFSADIIAEFF